MTDRLRAKLSRERRADPSQNVTVPSQNVTRGAAGVAARSSLANTGVSSHNVIPSSQVVTSASQNVTECHRRSHAVTPRHTPSHGVTLSLPSDPDPDPDPDPSDPSLPDAGARDSAAGFDSKTVVRVFSELRKSAGGGSYRLQHSDYDRAQQVVAWAREENWGDPAGACTQSVGRFLEHARGKEADGWPFWAWANDPGRWYASKPPGPVTRSSWGAKSGPAPVSTDEEFAEMRAELAAEELAKEALR